MFRNSVRIKNEQRYNQFVVLLALEPPLRLIQISGDNATVAETKVVDRVVLLENVFRVEFGGGANAGGQTYSLIVLNYSPVPGR